MSRCLPMAQALPFGDRDFGISRRELDERQADELAPARNLHDLRRRRKIACDPLEVQDDLM
jgi:hypothetical protein